MRINRLVVRNFKGFDERTFIFDRHFNLLVGVNGAGKSSALDALAVAVGSWFLGLRGYDTRHIGATDIRLAAFSSGDEIRFEEQFPVVVRAWGEVAGRPLEWARCLNVPRGRTTFGEAVDIKAIATDADRQVRAGEEVELPLISYYGTGRLWKEPKQFKQETQVKSPKDLEGQRATSRLEGYRNSIDPRLSVRDLVKWIARQSWVSFQRGQDRQIFTVVKNAILNCLEEAEDLYFDPQRGEVIVVLKGQGPQPFANLSDGQRVMLALVADIAQKAAKLNPQFGGDVLRKTRGIVLIDELDLHLHPKWQRRVVGDLKKTFPEVQFFATTHSPQIIGEVPANQVLLLPRDGQPVNASETLGRESGWILRYVMDADERTPEFRALLKEVESLIMREKFEEAKDKLKKLRNRFGSDPAIVELDASINFWDGGAEDEDIREVGE